MVDIKENIFDDLLDQEDEGVNAFPEEEPVRVQEITTEKPKEEPLKEDEVPVPEQETKQEEEESVKFEEHDYLNAILESKGLDPHAIYYEDENGNEVSKSFYELDPDEQWNILNYNPSIPELEEQEIATVNFFRENGIKNLNEYTEFVRNQTIQDMQNGDKDYNVDSYTDDDLYLEVLRQQYPNLTDDELSFELEKEKDNEDLYNKKVSQIRDYYKQQEEEYKTQEQQQAEKQEQLELQNAQDNLANSAIKAKDLMGFDIDDEDRKDVLKSVFVKDVNGKSQFFKMLEDPDKLFRVALFAIKEDLINNSLEDAFKKVSNNSQKPPIINTKPKVSIPKVSVKRNDTSKTSQRAQLNMHSDDLYSDLF